MAGMAIQAGNRMQGIGLQDDVGNRGVGRANIGGATGIVAESAIILMFGKDIVPSGQVAVASVMTDGAGLGGIGLSAKANSVILVAATGTVIVVGKIALMTIVAFAIRGRGNGCRAFQPAIGSQVVTGGTTASGMGLPRANEGRKRGVMATSTVGGCRCCSNIGLHRRGMTMGMTTKIGRVTIRAGGGGLAVSEGTA